MSTTAISSCSHFLQSASETLSQQAAGAWRSGSKWQTAPSHLDCWFNWQTKIELLHRSLKLCPYAMSLLLETVLQHPLRSPSTTAPYKRTFMNCLLVCSSFLVEGEGMDSASLLYKDPSGIQAHSHWCPEDFLLSSVKCYIRFLCRLFSHFLLNECTKLTLLTWCGTVTCSTQIWTAHLHKPTNTSIPVLLTYSSTALKAYRRQWLVIISHILRQNYI